MMIYPIGVPLFIFVLMYPHRKKIERLMQTLASIDMEHRRSSLTTVADIRRSSKQHRASIANLSYELFWLVSKFERYTPTCWWTGTMLLIFRLAQTSLLVWIDNQVVQATFAACVAQLAICMQRNSNPYRRDSGKRPSRDVFSLRGWFG